MKTSGIWKQTPTPCEICGEAPSYSEGARGPHLCGPCYCGGAGWDSAYTSHAEAKRQVEQVLGAPLTAKEKAALKAAWKRS